MQNKNYRENGGREGLHLSQSMIKSWKSFSPKKWYRKYIENIDDGEDENPAFLLGSLLDILLFTPDRLEQEFYISNLDKLPSESLRWIVDNVYKYIISENKKAKELESVLPEPVVLDLNLDAHKDLVLKYADLCPMKDKDGIKYGWQKNWKADTRYENIYKECFDYWDELCNSWGRKMITSTLNMQAIELIDILKKNKWTKDYLVESGDNELHFQLEIFAEYEYFEDIDKGNKMPSVENHFIPIKGALDILRINHADKTIQIVDFKKCFSVHEFRSSILKYNYDWQLSFYQMLLEFWIKDNPKYKTYKQLQPINIVIDIVDKNPMIFEYSQLDLHIARYGNKKLIDAIFADEFIPIKYKVGWEQLLNEISYHLVKNDFSCPREMIENGKIILNLNN